MVINTSANTLAGFSSNTFAVKSAADIGKAGITAGKSHGRFDTFVDMLNKNAADKNSEAADKVRAQKFALDTASIDWSFESAYRQMKSICENAMKYEEEAQKKFKDLQEEKAYYAELEKNKSKYIKEEGKYALDGLKEGDKIDKDTLSRAAEKVQEKIDSLIKGTEKYYERASKAYEIAGTIMTQVTGDIGKQYKSTLQPMLSQLPIDEGYNALINKQVSAFSTVSRNESNFLNYSENTKVDIEGKVESLEKLKEDFMLNEDRITPNYDTEQLNSLLFNLDMLDRIKENVHNLDE